MKSETKQLYIMLLITFVSFVGVSIPYPIFPPLILTSHSDLVGTNWAMHHRTLLLGLLLAAYPIGQFLGSPILGSFSDRFGRKTIMLSSLLVSIFGYLLTAFSIQKGNLGLLFFSRFLTGLSESNFAITQAMVADLKTINKHKGFGSVLMAASLGYIVGPLIGGFLSNQNNAGLFSVSFPFYIASGLTIITLILVYFILFETNNHQQKNSSIEWHDFNLAKHFRDVCRDRAIKVLLLATLLFMFSVDFFYEFGPAFLTSKFNMQAQEIAIYNLFLCIGLALSAYFISHRLAKYFEPQYIITTAIIIFSALLLTMTLTSSRQVLIWLFCSIGLMIPLASTSLRVQLSDSTDESIQGKVFGIQSSLRVLGDAIICLLGGVMITYSFTLAFLVSTLSALLAVFIFLSPSSRASVAKARDPLM